MKTITHSARPATKVAKILAAISGVAAALAGCAHTAVDDSGLSLKPATRQIGIAQTVGADGQPQFVACSPCLPPTPKTLAVLTVERTTRAEPSSLPSIVASPGAPAVQIASTAEPALADPASLPLKLDTEFESAKRLVPFAFSAATLGSRGKKAVEELIAAAIKAQTVYVRGRTDSTGTKAQNREIALQRAMRVRGEFLRGGVEKQKIRTTYCTTCYVASNATEEGRRANRRVEVELLLPRAEIAALSAPTYSITPEQEQRELKLAMAQVDKIEKMSGTLVK